LFCTQHTTPAPPPNPYCTFSVHVYCHPPRTHAFRFVIMKLIRSKDSINAAVGHAEFWNQDLPTLLLTDATFPHPNTTRIVHKISDSLFDTDLMTLNFTRLAIPVVTSDGCLHISVFNFLQRTAHYRQSPLFRLVQFRVL
jgi:hypothetical protein